MSYAPNTIRHKGSTPAADRAEDDAADYGDSGYDDPARARSSDDEDEPAARDHASGRPYDDERDWGRIGLAGLGLALGVIVGVGVALLYAPQSGEETRDDIRRRARRLRDRAGDAWIDLGDELRWLGRRGQKRVRRGVRRGSWAAEDLIDSGKRRLR